MIIEDLLSVLNEMASFSLAESWDNVGLMVGDPGMPVTGILVALDPTEDVLAEAIDKGLNTIVTHHPLIFHALKTVRTDRFMGRFLAKALAGEVAVISCHTNLDMAAGGVNDVLAAKLDLQDIEPLVAKKNDPSFMNDNGPQAQTIGFGRIGRLHSCLAGREFLDRLFTVLELDAIQVAGRLPDEIETVAVCGGSGSDLVEEAFLRGAQVYVSGEIKHSVARWAEAHGFCVVDAGHYATENMVVPLLVSSLSDTLEQKGMETDVRATTMQSSPYQYYYKVDKAIVIQ